MAKTGFRHGAVTLSVGVLLAGVAGAQVRRADDAPRLARPVTPPDIAVLRSDARAFVFEYRPRFSSERLVGGGGRGFSVLHFEGAVPTVTRPGAPDLRARAVSVALPDERGAAVRVVAADYEDLPGRLLAPVPRGAQRDGMAEPGAYVPDAGAYAASGLQPAEPVGMGPAGRVRSVVVATLRMFPLQFNPAAQSIRRYSRIVVEVQYAGRAAAQVEAPDLALLGDVLPNLRGGPFAAVQPAALRKAAAAPVPSVLATGEWYRIAVADEAIYKLDAAFFAAAGIPLQSLDPRTIKIYGNGGQQLSENPLAARPADLLQNAIHVEGEADGKFDAADYVLFYGRSVRGWRYDAAAKKLRHTINLYTETNHYWLTFGGDRGKRMAQQLPPAGSPTVVAERFTDGLAIEEEKVNKLSSGKEWYGQAFGGPSSSFTYVHTLPGLVPNDRIAYRYTLVGRSDFGSSFTVRQGGVFLGEHELQAVFSYIYATAGTFETSGPSSLANNTSQLGFTFQSPTAGGEGWVDWIEILYPRYLWAESNYLRFWSPDTTGLVEYRLQQFTAKPTVFNVTVPSEVRLVGGVGGAYSFLAPEAGGAVSAYVAAAPSAWRAPAGVQKMPNQDLRGRAAGAEFIIITAPEFRAAADDLKAFREQPAHGGHPTLVVDVNSVYNEFGGGLPDITAVRDFLKYAYETWVPRPVYVLFLGQASFDYKGLLGTRSSFVPTWQSLESRDDVDSYSTDDYFAKFGPSDVPSLVLGRVNARSAAEADLVVKKIIRYETASARDAWKMRMLFIGDDAWTPEGGDFGDGTIHSNDAETLASPYYSPDDFEKRKIYIAEYPTVNSTLGRRKPGAYQALIDVINEGVLVVNYSGHGNQNVWAHERIFEVGSSIPQLVNADRLSLFFLATCNFSQFDDPKSPTGSEVMMNRSEGGAIAVISACRKVYSGSNAALNQGTYQQLFRRDAYGRTVVERPAAALFQYKVAAGNGENDQKFFHMGDPTMRLQYPSGFASVDSVNGEPTDSLGGQPRQSAIQLRALQRVTVAGTIRDAAGRVDPSFSGTIGLTVNDASQQKVVVNFYPGANWAYLAPGGTIYRGENSVSNGRFRATFVVPKDIAYGDTLATGRLAVYFSSAALDGAGYTGKIRVGGTDSAARVDVQGPAIAIYLNSRSFRPGDVVDEKPVLLVDLADSSGINTSGSGIGHRIEAWLSGAEVATDLTARYSAALDDYRRGTVRFPLEGLPRGRNTVRVRAWDSYNNSAVAEASFEVASSDALAVADLFAYPNPFSSGTEFTFRHNQTGPLAVTIKVYTVAGRLVRAIEASTSGEPYVRIPWDGRDRDGDILANGVYLYKVVVRTPDGARSSESLGKLSVLR